MVATAGAATAPGPGGVNAAPQHPRDACPLAFAASSPIVLGLTRTQAGHASRLKVCLHVCWRMPIFAILYGCI